MLKFTSQIWIAFVIATTISCAPTRFVRPLDKDQQAVTTSAGGPLFVYGTSTIPMPFLTATYGRGLDSLTTGYGSLNITSALYGNIQAEAGISRKIFRQNGILPAISMSLTANIISPQVKGVFLYPQFDLNFYYEYGKHKNIFYFGADNWFELKSKGAHGRSQPYHWFFSPMAGHIFSKPKWDLFVEAKLIAPDKSNDKLVVDYVTPLKSQGAFGVYIGYTRKF